MSRLVGRILLAILMFPLASVLYVVTFVGVGRWVNYQTVGAGYDATRFTVAGLVTWVGVAVYWCGLWRKSVPWTAWRRAGTSLAAVSAAVVGAAAAVAGNAFVNGDYGFWAFVAGTLAVGLWLVATVFLWRETPAERTARAGPTSVACPLCGYNLTGLAEARCPECGGRFTLDQLLAAQPSQTAHADLT